jgi:signal transduction histidine kinase
MRYRVFLLFFIFCWTSLSAETLIIDGEEKYKTKKYLRYSLAYDLNETPQNLSGRKWEINKNTFNTPANSSNAYWAKIDIKNATSSSKIYYFQIENQFTFHIEFYLLKNNKVVSYIEDGVIAKNKERVFNTSHMIFPISLDKNEEACVYFKIRNYNKIDIQFNLVDRDYLLNFYQTYNMLEGLFFGGMLIMLLYNLFLYFLLKFRAYLYYVSYTFWLIVYFIGLFGFSQRYFAEYTWLFYISSGAFFISMTLFVQSILNLKENLPRINMVLNLFIVYFFVATLMNGWILERENFIYAQFLFNLFFILVPLYVSFIISITYYLALVKKDTVARIYSWVWTLVSMVGIFLPLIYLNIIETEIPSDYIFQFLILFEVLCFSFILAYKIKLMQKEGKSQENLLVQQNKLASMGEMISTIAHQWRQPLSEINGIVLEIDIDSRKQHLNSETLDKHLNEIESVTAYMSGTISDFMNFFKHDKKLNYFYISDAIKRAIVLLSSSQKRNHVEISYDIEESIELYSYQSELIQALLIILNNSMDAINIKKIFQPIIHLKIETKGENLSISIQDNAGGIPLEILDKVYNPYFTTKHEFKGTGMGLYILKMLIEKSIHGSVEIVNANGGVLCILSIPISLKSKM